VAEGDGPGAWDQFAGGGEDRLGCEGREVGGYIVRQGNQTAVDKLECRDGGKELGHGSESEERGGFHGGRGGRVKGGGADGEGEVDFPWMQIKI